MDTSSLYCHESIFGCSVNDLNMICVLQMLLPNAIFLRQFESRMMFAKVWLQFTNMFSEVAELRGLGGAIHAI